MTSNQYIFPSRKDEVANSITHAAGILFSIVATTTIFSLAYNQVAYKIGLLVFTFCMMEMYTVSTVYHFEKRINVKTVLRLFDHISIYFLIAGTYTPFLLICLKGSEKWLMLSIIWSIVILGILYKLFWWKRFPRISLYFYLAMGWMIVFFIKPVYQSLPLTNFLWLIVGGLFYSGGTYFYSKDKKLYNHAIWHLFVLAGSISHFVAIVTAM